MRKRKGGEEVASEWLVGVFDTPARTPEGEVRAAIIYEHPSGIVVHVDATTEKGVAPAVKGTLAARERQRAEDETEPTRIRVADPELAAALVGQIDVPVLCAATPELAPVVDSLVASLSKRRAGPGPDDFVPARGKDAEGHRALFAAAADLFRAAPWRTISDHDLLHLSSSDPGLDGAVVSMMGQAGQHLGMLVFSSEADFEHFFDFAAAHHEMGPDRRPRVPAAQKRLNYLVLDFNRRDEISPKLRSLLRIADLPLATPDAIPMTYRFEAMTRMKPAVPAEVRRLAAAAHSIADYWRTHGAAIRDELDRHGGVSASRAHKVTTPVGPEVTVRDAIGARDPEPAGRHFDIQVTAPLVRPRAAEPTTPRNAPCPCGSGQKYKLCHLPIDIAAAAPGLDEQRYLCQRLDARLARFAEGKLGPEIFDEPGELFADSPDPDAAITPILIAIGLYHYPWSELGDRAIADAFHAEAPPLELSERAILDTQRAAWISLFQVTAVDKGRSVTVRDLLTGEERTCVEHLGSQTLQRWQVLLTRVVDLPAGAQLYGLYGRALSADMGESLADEIRRELKLKKGVHATIARMRTDRAIVTVLRAVVALFAAEAARPLPELHTTTGEKLIHITDHFMIESGHGASIAASLIKLGFQSDDEDAGDGRERRFALVEETDAPGLMGSRIIATAVVKQDAIELITVSKERADRARSMLEGALGDKVRHAAREHADPTAELRTARRAGVDSPEPPSEAMSLDALPAELREELARRVQEHWREWLDESLPALNGKTPRQAAADPRRRKQLARLLRDFEGRAADPLFAPDVAKLRAELGVGEDER